MDPMYQEGSPLAAGFEQRVAIADKLKPIAAELDCSHAQMAITWAVSNENVSTVLLGASRASQLEENLQAIGFVSKITPEEKAQIDAIANFEPTVPTLDPYAMMCGRHL